MMTGFKMQLPLLPTIFISVLLLAGTSLLPGIIVEGMPPTSIAMNPERRQLLEDALYWMTFMQNGTYASNKTVQSLFLKQVLERYQNSKFYRSFVIAFQFGVLPRLTMVWGSQCDPSLIPRDPFNRSLTWHYLKNLTFRSYKDRHLITPGNFDRSNKYCDYRQGLYCLPDRFTPTQGLCQCPDEADYVQINYDPANPRAPPIHRCLLKKGQPCALIDLNHGNDPKHSSLAADMYHLMFNLDKPIPCSEGTQCRFKDRDLSTPKCYDPSQGPFHPPPPFPNGTIETWTLQLGASCTIGLYADPGSCEVNTYQKYGALPGLVCYNFRLPKANDEDELPVDHRKGFCAHEHGQYGVVTVATSANGQLQFHPLFMPYVYPLTVPLRDDKLLSYYLRFLTEVHKKLFLDGVQREAGESCDVQRTEEFSDLFWNFYSKELAMPPKNVTEAELEDKLEEAINLANDTTKGICRVYPYHYRSSPAANRQFLEPLTCIPGFGNDSGLCESSGYVDVDMQTYADNLADFLDKTSLIEMEQLREDVDVDEEIIRDNPETSCVPSPPDRHSHTAPLGNGECPQGYFCYEDYGDHQNGLYDAACELNPAVKPALRCHEEKDGIEYEKCEVDQLEELISQHIPEIEAASSLGLGDTCDHEEEWIIRSWVRDRKDGETNKYKVLQLVETLVSSKREFCNASKLLECKPENECGCVESTAPRTASESASGLESDYCFLTRGPCNGIDLSTFVPLLPNELKEALEEYGESKTVPGDFCSPDANLCWYLDTERAICRADEDIQGRGVEFAGTGDLRGENKGSWMWLAVASCFI